MNQKRMPLVEALTKFAESDPVSFHVPGHKHGALDGSGLLQNLGRYDATELTSLDDLHSPEGPIKESMELLKSHYQSRSSYFLVNGTTVGNITMLLGTCDPGDIVLIASNSHKSIINACALSRVRPVFLQPEIHPATHTPAGISSDVLEKAVKQYSNVKALVITYPTYYGHTYPIDALIETAHKKGILVLVDEAHGAHLTLGRPFPPSALRLGADMVVQSAHKTLPAMTMGSYLHIGSDRVDQRKVESILSMLQSSSPSYPIMASLDSARAYLAAFSQEDINSFISKRNSFVNKLRKLPTVTVIEPEDPLKLVLRVNGYTGYELQKLLERYSIYIELADLLQVLMILPLLQENVSYDDSFSRMIMAMDQITDQTPVAGDIFPDYITLQEQESITELDLELNRAENAPSHWINIKKAAGRIAAESIVPYPPGIPFVIAGERLSENKINQLAAWKGKGIRIQGENRIDSGEIKVVQVMEESND
ncbi:aminotransferase class I/II-fold pyridoxal phosphate-dependent enzyme [Jeotgalibacillus sp. S-D1]|uniref:aminotransferase class I/II-fold pyridoxal phosphate-dependent enzyme n=1 Tax=Jeotgalibacillus sp. S-D1 TaxID=2552189 RepID=UPI00140554E0|nr:aminotransferase class I/II-fold pyridoxal phosphate-dependent enzyme [Jeotgalibacillus sp. S-D1]